MQTTSLQTSNLIKNFNGVSVAYKCDVTKTNEVSEVAAQVRKDLGEVDILVNNAGVLMCKSIVDLSEKEIRKTMEINAVAQFWVCMPIALGTAADAKHLSLGNQLLYIGLYKAKVPNCMFSVQNLEGPSTVK